MRIHYAEGVAVASGIMEEQRERNYSVNVTTDFSAGVDLMLKVFAEARLALLRANHRSGAALLISETTSERDSEPRVIFSGLARSAPDSLTKTEEA